MYGRISVENVLKIKCIEYYWVSQKPIWPLDMSTSSILYDIIIYGAHICVSGPYKYSLRFSESGRILKQSIRQIKLTWSVNYVCEIFHSRISDKISTLVRRINRAAALCCPVALTYGAAILRLENEARHANFEKELFQSVTKYVQHPLKIYIFVLKIIISFQRSIIIIFHILKRREMNTRKDCQIE